MKRWLVTMGLLLAVPTGAAAGTPTPSAVRHNLANALAKAGSTRVLHFHRHRAWKPPNRDVTEAEWVDFANGEQRRLGYDAKGRLVTDVLHSYSDAPRSANAGTCGCDIDPFTNFPNQKVRASVVGEETLDGRQTFHLRFVVTGNAMHSTVDFWIDRASYLPVHSKVVFRETYGKSRTAGTTVDDFAWLPRTRANLAHVKRG